MKGILGTLVLLCAALLMACGGDYNSNVSLFDPEKVACVVGTEFVDSDRADSYRMIFWYYVDYKNNIYIGDVINRKIDKFNKYGQYEVTFGGPGQGPGELSGSFPIFCADSHGYVISSVMKTICIYDNKGKYSEEIAYPDDFKGYYCAMIRADHNDDLVISLRSADNEYKYLKFTREDRSFKLFHIDSRRRGTYHNFFRFIPGYDFDEHNNIYVLDSVENRIYIYDSSGKSFRTIDGAGKKQRITGKDLFFTTGNHIVEKIPVSYLKQLSGDSKYWPINCGINIDKDIVFLWKSDQDAEYKRLIEIFDDRFNLLGRSSFYNTINYNMVYMRNGFAYFVNVGDEDIEYKKSLGRMGIYNPPYKVICYRYDFP